MKFRNVPTFHLDDGESMAYIAREDATDMVFEFDCASLNVDQAKRLRDWLTGAIPAETGAEHE